MGTINHNKFLPELLKGTKTQIIEPLFPVRCKHCGSKKIEQGSITYPDREVVAFFCKNPKCEKLIQAGWKEPRFKIGEVIKPYWKMRTPKARKNCIYYVPIIAKVEMGTCNKWGENRLCHNDEPLTCCAFTHKLPNETVSEVFVVEMLHSNFNNTLPKTVYSIKTFAPQPALRYAENSVFVEDLASRDSGGKWKAADMFKFFNDNYGLNQKKRFGVYRW